MKKKMLAALLCSSMVMSLFVGCGNTDKDVVESKTEESKKEESKVEESSSEVVEEEPEVIEINWLGYTTSGYVPEADSYAELLLEERNNVKINWVHSIDQNNIRLQFASGAYEEVDVFSGLIYGFEAEGLYNDGLIREFPEEWLWEYYPTGMQYIVETVGQEFIDNGGLEAGGKILGLPYIGRATTADYVMSYRKDWADKLGISEPTTLDELHDMLYAFTYDDPDGNGEDDTYGILTPRGWVGPWFLFGAFGIQNQMTKGNYIANADGTISYTAVMDEYKQALSIWKDWYDEGIVCPDVITADRGLTRSHWANGMVGAITDTAGWFLDYRGAGSVKTMLTNMNGEAEVAFLKPITSQYGDGKVYRGREYNTVQQGAGTMYFTKDTSDEKVIAVLKIMESMSSDEEFHMSLLYGEKGVDYSIYDGFINVASHVDMEYQAEKGIGESFYGFGMKSDAITQLSYTDEDKEMVEVERSWPSVYYGNNWMSSANTAMDTYGAEVEKIETEFYHGVLLGEYDIDADWDEYVERMNKAGLADIIAEYEKQIQ